MVYTLLSFTEETLTNYNNSISSKKSDLVAKHNEDILEQKVFFNFTERLSDEERLEI